MCHSCNPRDQVRPGGSRPGSGLQGVPSTGPSRGLSRRSTVGRPTRTATRAGSRETTGSHDQVGTVRFIGRVRCGLSTAHYSPTSIGHKGLRGLLTAGRLSSGFVLNCRDSIAAGAARGPASAIRVRCPIVVGVIRRALGRPEPNGRTRDARPPAG
jgi:hypothetical protein